MYARLSVALTCYRWPLRVLNVLMPVSCVQKVAALAFMIDKCGIDWISAVGFMRRHTLERTELVLEYTPLASALNKLRFDNARFRAVSADPHPPTPTTPAPPPAPTHRLSSKVLLCMFFLRWQGGFAFVF